ncbi:hypothetical protein Fmac_001594 [Flemingia macrophylla]|uniref:Uncharacterized protein n=1 Tax=Flemingia macrophylla TaxID=520843 RepID=A0ABD1NHL8_9FABA
MVMRGSEQQPRPNFMAPSPKGSNPLHSSSFPFLNWGKNRRIRSAAVGCDGGDHRSSASNSDESTATRSKESGEKQPHGGDEDGIAVVRRRLILDLKTETNRMKDAIFRSKEEAVRPWNLRKRRAKVEAPAPADKRRNQSVQLSKKEIEEDFKAMLGHLPPRRPNKRPKHVQKLLDALCPGLWLAEVTVDSYKVIEAAENGNVRHNGKRKVDVGF